MRTTGRFRLLFAIPFPWPIRRGRSNIELGAQAVDAEEAAAAAWTEQLGRLPRMTPVRDQRRQR